jgi:hypothetical protein
MLLSGDQVSISIFVESGRDNEAILRQMSAGVNISPAD